MLHFFYKLKARSSTSKKITARFIAMLALLWTRPTISLRCACNKVREKIQNEEKRKISEKGICQIWDLDDLE